MTRPLIRTAPCHRSNDWHAEDHDHCPISRQVVAGVCFQFSKAPLFRGRGRPTGAWPYRMQPCGHPKCHAVMSTRELVPNGGAEVRHVLTMVRSVQDLTGGYVDILLHAKGAGGGCSTTECVRRTADALYVRIDWERARVFVVRKTGIAVLVGGVTPRCAMLHRAGTCPSLCTAPTQTRALPALLPSLPTCSYRVFALFDHGQMPSVHALGDMSVYVRWGSGAGEPLLSSSSVETHGSLGALSSYDAVLSESHHAAEAYRRAVAPALVKLKRAGLLEPHVLAVPPPLAPTDETLFDRQLKSLLQNHEISFFWRPLAKLLAAESFVLPNQSPYAACIVEMRTSITFPLVVRLNMKVRECNMTRSVLRRVDHSRLTPTCTHRCSN